MSKKATHAVSGHTKKHTKKATVKHHAKAAKHKPSAHQLHLAHLAHLQHLHTVGKPATPAKGLALSPGDIACCTAEALAASLRLSGTPVSDEDMLRLFWRAGGDEDAGAPILATLEAAARYGLGGARVASFGPVTIENVDSSPVSGLILGLQDHAVLATPEGWWSWGELHDPGEWPDAVIGEAWVISWR